MASASSLPSPNPSGSLGPWDPKSILEQADQGFKTFVKDDPVIESLVKKGVMLRDKKQIYKVDESRKNIFIVLLKDLAVDWLNDDLYWNKMTARPDYCRDLGIDVKVAQLVGVCWLNIAGEFRTELLSRDTTYEILLEAKLHKDYNLKDVRFKITLPGENEPKDDMIDFKKLPEESWGTLHLYDLTSAQIKKGGEVKFRIYSHSNSWKRGFVLGGVSFKPKPSGS